MLLKVLQNVFSTLGADRASYGGLLRGTYFNRLLLRRCSL